MSSIQAVSTVGVLTGSGATQAVMSTEFTTFREQKTKRASLSSTASMMMNSASSKSTFSASSLTSMKSPVENYYETLGEPQIITKSGGVVKKKSTGRDVTYANLPDVVTSKRDVKLAYDDDYPEGDDDDESPTYENLQKPESVDGDGAGNDYADDEESATYMNVASPKKQLGHNMSTYDVPRSSRPIYDSPRRNNSKVSSTATTGRVARGTPSPDYMNPDAEEEYADEEHIDDDDQEEEDEEEYAMYDTAVADRSGRRYDGHQQDNWRYTPDYCEPMNQGLEVILEEPELECCQSSSASSDADSCCCDCEDGDDCSCCGDSTSSLPPAAGAASISGSGEHLSSTLRPGTVKKQPSSGFSSSTSSISSSSSDSGRKLDSSPMGFESSVSIGGSYSNRSKEGADQSWSEKAKKSANRDDGNKKQLISASSFEAQEVGGLTVAEAKKQANGSSIKSSLASLSGSASAASSTQADKNEIAEVKRAKEKALAALLQHQQPPNPTEVTPENNKERLLEVYHETVRQRNNNKSVLASILAFNNAASQNTPQVAPGKPSRPNAKDMMAAVMKNDPEEAKQEGDKYRLPSVKDLRCRFEQDAKTGKISPQPPKLASKTPSPLQSPFKQQPRSPTSPAVSPKPVVSSSNSPALAKKPAIIHPKPVAALSPVAKKIEAAKNKAQSGSGNDQRAPQLLLDAMEKRSKPVRADLKPSRELPARSHQEKIEPTSAGSELLTWKALSKNFDADRKEKVRSQFEDLRNAKIESLDQMSDSEDSGINSNQSPILIWDPVKLAKELYAIEQPDPPGTNKTLSRLRPTFESINADSKAGSGSSKNIKSSYINMEGYLEKLPSGRKKVTFWNAWKRRFFRLENGYLRYYQSPTSEKPSQTLQLMGGSIDTIDNMFTGNADEAVLQQKQMFPNVLGIDDGKGHYLVVKCANKNDVLTWQKALLTHVQENFAATYVQPSPLLCEPSSFKKVLVLDIGSRSLRAGFLSKQPTLPQVFLPTAAAVDRKSPSKMVFGFEAFCTEVRTHSQLVHPLRVTHKPSQKHHWDWNVIEGILDYAVKKAKVDNAADYEIVVTIPWHLSSREFQLKLLDVLFRSLGFKAAYVLPQALAAFHVYNASSGIVVDVGERLDVLPITHGFVVELGASKILCGGETLTSHLSMCLPGGSQTFAGQGDKLAVRYAMERLCYCAMDYASEMDCFESDSRQFRRSVALPVKGDDHVADCDSPLEIELDCGRFHGPEGLFKPELWGLDSPGIHKLVHKAIQECGVDVRREMSRNIFLSGGLTLIPGFAERLAKELDKLTPSTLTPKVHASPHRYHAAYLGAQALSESPAFSRIAITQEEWRTMGQKVASKLSA